MVLSPGSHGETQANPLNTFLIHDRPWLAAAEVCYLWINLSLPGAIVIP